MPSLKSPASYILALTLLILVLLAAWLFWTRKPLGMDSAPAAEAAPGKNEVGSGGLGSTPSLPPASAGSGSSLAVDPMHQEMADRLHSPDTTPQQDMETVADFISIYSKAFGGNPIGGNEDITAAMTGYDGKTGRVFPPRHRTIKNGQLVDRWGTPYWFHPNAGNRMEIRSAGPDLQLFTVDDIVQNPSPPGLGVTPTAAPQEN